MIASIYRLSRQDVASLHVTDDYSLHRIVYDLFPGSRTSSEGRTFLYADKGGGFSGRIILLLSRNTPSEPVAGTLASRKVTPSFLSHDHYAFEVVLNPSRRDAKTGKTVAVLGTEKLREWFEERTALWGFDSDKTRLQISGTGIQRFEHKDRAIVSHNRATFSGILTVTERSAFMDSFGNGIGRCRGFGFGLLQLRPVIASGPTA